MKKLCFTILLLIVAVFSMAKDKSSYEKGINYFNEKDFTKAKIELENSLIENPNLTFANIFLGLIYCDNGDYGRALANFVSFTAKPADEAYLPKAYQLIVLCYSKQSKWQTALDKALEFSNLTTDQDFKRTLGTAYLNVASKTDINLRNPSKYVEYCQKSVELFEDYYKNFPNDVWIKNDIGRAYLLLYSAKDEKDLTILNRATKYLESEKEPYFILNLSVAERFYGDFYKMEAWRFLPENGSKTADTNFQACNKFIDAKKKYEKAIELIDSLIENKSNIPALETKRKLYVYEVNLLKNDNTIKKLKCFK